MLKRVVMKKFLSAILILLSMTLLMADSPALTIYEGNIDDVELFAPDGTPLSVLSDINESGYIIRTQGEAKAFASQYGDIYLQGDSMLAVTGFTTADPTLYLVYGTANIVMKTDLTLSVYTPTSRTTIQGEGEYAFVSTDTEETFMNYSESSAESYDAMRAVRTEVPSMSELDYARGTVERTTQERYYTTSVLCDLIIYDEAETDMEIPVIAGGDESEAEIHEAIETSDSEDSEEIEAILIDEEEETVPEPPVIIETIVSGPDSEEQTAVPEAPIVIETATNLEEDAIATAEEEESEEIAAAEVHDAVPEPPVMIEAITSLVGPYPEKQAAVPEAPIVIETATDLEEDAIATAEEEESEEIAAAEVHDAVPEPPVMIEAITSLVGPYPEKPAAVPEAPTFAGFTTTLEMGVPSAPVFTEPETSLSLTVPTAPVFLETTSSLVPAVPTFTENADDAAEASLPEPPTMTDSTLLAEDEMAEESEKEPLVKFAVELGASYPLNWNKAADDGEPLILVTPSVTIGRGNWQIGLRVPLKMAFINSFRLAGMSGKENWDFGTDDSYTKEEVIYNAITDSMSLIDHLYLGNPDSTIAYLRMERGYERNGTIFSSYGWDEGLAVRMGFNFSNLSFQVYLDNAEAPHIGEFGVSFYPFAFRGAAFSINVPTEFLFENFNTYSMNFFPEVRLDLPFAQRRFILSAFAVGSMYTEYESNELVQSEIVWDFARGEMLPFVAGAELAFNFSPVSVVVNGGYRKGLSTEYFNEFTFAGHEVYGQGNASNDTAFFASASLTLDFDVVKVGLSYSVDNIEGFRNSDPSDIARLRIEGNITDIADIYATASIRNLVSSFSNFDAAYFFMGGNTLFAIGTDLDFGMFGLTAEARTVHIPDSTADDYLNVHKLSADSYLQFKLLGRVEF